MNYRLIFKDPVSGSGVAVMNLVCTNEDAAVERFRGIAGYMAGELWRGEARLRTIAAETMQFTR